MELEMKTEGKKLEFYTGRWVSFLPFIIFLGMIIVSVVLDAVSERSMWICCIVGLMIAFFLAKDKIRYGDAIAEGIAQKLTSVPVLFWIFAGIFTTTLRAAGLVQGIVWVAYNVGAHGMLFVLVAFISCAAFATAAGTGLGTTIAGISILYPAGCLLGANPLVLAGAIIGGGAFGDNLAPVSDTTICSALTQGADITGVVKSRLRYSAVAAAITILFILFFGGGGSITGEALPHDLIAEYMNPKGLLMLIPAILTIYLAIKKGDVIYACIAGTAAVIVVALPTGLLTLSDIICLSDGGVSGTLVDGIGGMADIVILCLLVMGMVGVMKAGEGDKLLIDIATKVIRGVCGAELSIVILSAILAGMTGINTPAILAIGVPYAKPMGERFHIHPYRRANLLDASSCSLAYTLPWTSIALATATYSAQGNALFGDVVPAIGAEEIFFYPVYAWALLAIMLFASITGWGRRFAGPNGEELKKLPEEVADK